jgi:hypothetical protein
MHKVFISYHHRNDQQYKDALIALNDAYRIFIDGSVELGDISDSLPHETIRRIIRDDFLNDSTVTVLLAGLETWGRKHVDWELKSSMIDGSRNRKSGIVVIVLPEADLGYFTAAHEEEKSAVFPDCTSWTNLTTRAAFEERYPWMPDRIVDNLVKPEAKISVIPWQRVVNNPECLRVLIDTAARDRLICEYDLSREMRMNNAPER